VVAIDGKTVRRSGHKRSGKAPIHMVSAFAARQRLVLDQVKVAEKSNEIIAIPKLLDMLAIEGAIITIDAMGCQREIAQKIVDKKADYVLALKGNQGSLREDVELLAPNKKPRGSPTPRSPRIRRSTVITGASRPEPPPLSRTLIGYKNATNGPACTPSSWSKAAARSAEKSSTSHAFTSPRW
jgi:hypothetical protein